MLHRCGCDVILSSFVLDTGCQEARSDSDLWEHSREMLQEILLAIAEIPPPGVLLGVWAGADCSLTLRETAPQYPCRTSASTKIKVPASLDKGCSVHMGWTVQLPTPGCSGRCRHSPRTSQLQYPSVNNWRHEDDKDHRNTEGNRAKSTILSYRCCLQAQTALPEQTAPTRYKPVTLDPPVLLAQAHLPPLCLILNQP